MKCLYGTKSVNAAAIVSFCWKELSPEEKARYHKMAADDKFRYYEEKGEYERRLKRTKVEAKQRSLLNATWDGQGPKPPESLRSCKSSSFELRSSGSAKRRLVAMLQKQRSHVEEEQRQAIVVPPYSRESIAHLASKLDTSSIDFLIKALK